MSTAGGGSAARRGDDAADARRARAAAQLLDGGTRTPRDAVAHLLAVQAQDLRAARLALRARGAATRAADVDAALADRSLVVAWLMRGTLHLVAAEDHGWLLALTARQNAAPIARRLGQLGVAPDTADRAVDVIASALADGPLTRAAARRAAATPPGSPPRASACRTSSGSPPGAG